MVVVRAQSSHAGDDPAARCAEIRRQDKEPRGTSGQTPQDNTVFDDARRVVGALRGTDTRLEAAFDAACARRS